LSPFENKYLQHLASLPHFRLSHTPERPFPEIFIAFGVTDNGVILLTPVLLNHARRRGQGSGGRKMLEDAIEPWAN
jgi:hypothetical protein